MPFADREARAEYQRQYRKANREALAEYQRQYREANREAILERDRRYHEANRETRGEAHRRWNEANREALNERRRQYYEDNREALLEQRRISTVTVRMEVFAHYSPSTPPCCACCGITENLTIDHINGGGTAHRISIFGVERAGRHFYCWLIRENFPPGYQVLCKPCNSSKNEGESCQLDHSNSAGYNTFVRLAHHKASSPSGKFHRGL